LFWLLAGDAEAAGAADALTAATGTLAGQPEEQDLRRRLLDAAQPSEDLSGADRN